MKILGRNYLQQILVAFLHDLVKNLIIIQKNCKSNATQIDWLCFQFMRNRLLTYITISTFQLVAFTFYTWFFKIWNIEILDLKQCSYGRQLKIGMASTTPSKIKLNCTHSSHQSCAWPLLPHNFLQHTHNTAKSEV